MKTDKQLQKDVMSELYWEPSINSAHIGVEVEQGVVTLSGHVDNLTQKWTAERVVKRVAGVRAVAFDLEVKLPDSEKRNDTDIALSAINMLESTSSIPKGSIHVTVEDSVVTLRGDVTWDFERQAAESMIRRLHGVRSVIDLIALKPKVSLTAVKAEIEAAMRRRAYLEAQQIQVMVDGDTITLSGKVQNWAERNLALNSAWGTPGVRSVVDKMSFV